MKKNYISPSLLVTQVEVAGQLLSNSLEFGEGTMSANDTPWVKSDNTSSSSYDVWSDDWSK